MCVIFVGVVMDAYLAWSTIYLSVCLSVSLSLSPINLVPRAKYKYKARKRVFEKAMAPPPSQSQSMDTTDGPGPSQPSTAASQTAGGGSIGGSKVDAPMRGFTVFVIGKFSKSKPVLTRQIEDLGGRVVSKVTDNTTICISNDSTCAYNKSYSHDIDALCHMQCILLIVEAQFASIAE